MRGLLLNKDGARPSFPRMFHTVQSLIGSEGDPDITVSSCLVSPCVTKVESHQIKPINEIPTMAKEEARRTLG